MRITWLLFLLLLPGCDLNSSDDVLQKEEAGIQLTYDLNGETTEIAYATSSELIISCPEGVSCDQSFDYRAQVFEDENIYIYLSFGPEIVDSYSLQTLSEHFNYLDFRLKLPDQSTEKTDVYFSHRQPVTELNVDTYPDNSDGMLLQFNDYSDHVLSGAISGIATQLTAYTEDATDPDCKTDDMMGICYENRETYMPFSVVFTIRVQEE
ncbi:hypothetical protein [Ferrimonas marina]|uniref:Uncharacterized protein n=1 Tax=Ferrimonas marina TaxID=299255 RepID=A0A1M5MNB3_9GAMM|nr:hypothetical protein [Ferrimonas marina]SHG78409.1 hypothetical protein SAMN02745129_0698 [Ferrimonas marina]